MTRAFDPRIVQVTLEFPSGNLTYEGLSIYATGQKYFSTVWNTCNCTIYNLTKDQRNYILSRTSPMNVPPTNVKMSLNVGRESYGTFTLFNGNVSKSRTTQPPDIGVELIGITGLARAGFIRTDSNAATTQLSTIAANIASANGVALNFLATDKAIENYNFTGAAIHQVRDLNNMGDIIASIDNDVLTVIDAGNATNEGSILISAKTGMVGIPQFNESGVTVKMMIDNRVKIGNRITVQSEKVPAANGDYIVEAMFYEVASRDQQFFYTLECRSVNYSLVAGTL